MKKLVIYSLLFSALSASSLLAIDSISAKVGSVSSSVASETKDAQEKKDAIEEKKDSLKMPNVGDSVKLPTK